MRKHFFISFLLLATISVTAQTKKPTPAAKPKVSTPASAVKPLKTLTDSLSYAFGISLGEYLKNQGVGAINYALLTKAIEQTIKNQSTYLNAEQANAVIGSVAQAKAAKITTVEKEKGRKFLEQNAKKAGVKQTASGLQYEVLVEGKGAKPALADTIMAHYKGTLLNGAEFDNSYTRGQPLQIPVAGVIPGWTEALQMMPAGSKWRLYIPSSLGYGDYGAGGEIPGGATLIFEVELLEILKSK
jgi:FKBP-type peptidyl-prolyl cis-trans isomerase FklB